MRDEAIDRVRLVFTLLDANKTGHLDADDFELMARRVVAASPDSGEHAKEAMRAAFRRYWETLAAELDTNRDGLVSFEEYSACVLSPERFDATVSDFAESLAALGDPDGDGRIERPLFLGLMTAIGFEPANIHALFDDLRPNPADEIQVRTWVEAIKDYYRPEKAGIAGDRLVGTPA